VTVNAPCIVQAPINAHVHGPAATARACRLSSPVPSISNMLETLDYNIFCQFSLLNMRVFHRILYSNFVSFIVTAE